MKIESIIKRDPPTRIRLGGTVYQFAVDSEGRHVVDVTNEEHIARLLSIPEGYRVVLEKDEKKADKILDKHPQDDGEPANDNIEPIGSTVHPEEIDLGGGHIVGRDVAMQVAIEDNGLTVEQWNALRDDERHNLIDTVLDGMASQLSVGDDDQGSEEEGDTESPAELDRDQLAAEYKERFGKAPHGKWSAEKILDELNKA